MSMRRSVLRFVLVLTVVFFGSAPVWAQWATPTIDGTISAGEYGNNNSLSNAGNTGQTWYMTWDATNLYVGILSANLSEGAVIYVNGNPQNPPACCTNADGDLTGFNYDGTNFASLPFRAKFVTYFKTGYREYRNSDGGGSWTSATSNYGSYADGSSGNVREVAIPWVAITNGGGIPSSFVFFGYLTSSGGFVFGQVPTDNNIGGFIGTNATATMYYAILNTGNGTSTPPFSNEQPAVSASQQLVTLLNTISSFGVPSGTARNLNEKVNDALVALNSGDTATACSDLADMISLARAQSGKKLTVAQANAIISAATQVRSQLGCT
jgi:hypothetical protein